VGAAKANPSAHNNSVPDQKGSKEVAGNYSSSGQ